MNSNVSIIMYHYVRDLKHSRFPLIKGLDIELFKEQVRYLAKHYNIIKMQDLIDTVEGKTQLPEKSALLTFDDGYLDHYQFVFPVLDQYGLQGSFFPPARAIMEHKILDVNKIHFILASGARVDFLITDIFDQLDQYRNKYGLDSNKFYWDKLAVNNRFDTAEVIFIKRLLQVELHEDLRCIIVDRLFKKYVSSCEESFCRELYMNPEQIACMQRHGMHIGSHGYNHFWLSSLVRERQEAEIDKSIEFLTSIGADPHSWTMCYPYGDYNADTLGILKEKKFKLALTTRVNVAQLGIDNAYELPRLDTNDIPKSSQAMTNEWYDKA